MVDAKPMLSIRNLSLQVGQFRLNEFSLDIERGEYFILLGPTGCGKTLLVETICGLNSPDQGEIYLDGKEITQTDPARRKIGYVPQDYALLPFKTVEQNIAFGLQARQLKKAEIKKRLDTVFEMLELEHLRQRLPGHLSGGERQRVALGRALAIEPDVMVLDEPLSALDENTCKELRQRLKKLHADLDTTFIHICHRLEEALSLGNKLALMRDGNLEQTGTPEQLIEQPRNLFVAEFLQLPNLMKGEIITAAAGNYFHINDTPVKKTDLPVGPAYGVSPLRDLTVSLEPPGENNGFVVLKEEIAENRTGPHAPCLRFRKNPDLSIPGIFPGEEWKSGQQVFLKLPSSTLHVLPENGAINFAAIESNF